MENSKQVAQIILSQIKQGGVTKMMSWGVNRLSCGTNENGTHFLSFFVNGFLHKGKVKIDLEYNDTYTIKLFNTNHIFVKSVEMVYCDELTDMIDSLVEFDGDIDSYTQKTKEGWLNL
jgi:hypothetical protein